MTKDRTLPRGYRLSPGPTRVADYRSLRQRAGLPPKTREQAKGALAGGWYLQVVDMAVLPDHQRRGLGDAVLRSLLEQARSQSPVGAMVSPLADPAGRGLYARRGFVETAPWSVAMALHLD